jgi:hypothetical protein
VFHLTRLRYSMQIHGSLSIVSIALLCSNPKYYCPMTVMCSGEYAGSGTVKGKPVIVRDTHGIVRDFVRTLNEATEVKMACISG